jgi:hypothetical protein
MTTPANNILTFDHARLQLVKQSLELFFPDPPEDAWLVASWLAGPGQFRSRWFRCADFDQAADFVVTQSARSDTYVGMGLRHPACPPTGRGTSDDVYAIGSLWVEMDHNAGTHATPNLPTPFQLIKFLQTLPWDFSLLIDSTGGYHGHLLLKELWVLDTPAERATAHLLLRRLQRTVQLAMATKGWHLDPTSDLARVLRPAGTFNWKSGAPQPVTLFEHNPVRYNPSDLLDAPWLAEVIDSYTSPAPRGDFADAHLDRMVPGCGWLAHCRDDAATLSEPEWYAMLGLVGRCVDGDQHAHAWSAPYPHYSQAETSKKLQHALAAAGPATCTRIRYDLGGESYCQPCPHWEQIASPIVLAMDDGVRLVGRTLPYVRPKIEITPAISQVVQQAERALLAIPQGPVLYQRARRLVLISTGGTPPKWLQYGDDIPTIARAGKAYLRGLLADAALWAKYDKRSQRWEETLPPSWAVDMLHELPAWQLPRLEGIVCTPTFRPDGSLLDTPGYDPDTGLYFHPNGHKPLVLPARPSQEDAQRALRRLKAIFRNFPFAAPHHLSAVCAAILSLLARYAIQKNVPLFAVRSTTRGSGKGLLIDVISMIVTGRTMARMAQTREEDEDRKRIITLVLSGLPAVHIDNVTAPLGSAALDAVLTGDRLPDRLLGTNEYQEAPATLVFFASGNNMQFRGDTARRVVPIDLAPIEERPDERTGFAHTPLLPRVYKYRLSLVKAALTVLKAFFVAARPRQPLTPFGSYEEWSRLIRECLVWAGELDPCMERPALETYSDTEHEDIATLLACWHMCYPTTARALKDAIQDVLHLGTLQHKLPANHWDALREAFGAFDPRYDGYHLRNHYLGQTLRRLKGRIVNQMRFVGQENKHTKVLEWRVEALT